MELCLWQSDLVLAKSFSFMGNKHFSLVFHLKSFNQFMLSRRLRELSGRYMCGLWSWTPEGITCHLSCLRFELVRGWRWMFTFGFWGISKQLHKIALLAIREREVVFWSSVGLNCTKNFEGERKERQANSNGHFWREACHWCSH